jgi:hypothetical protein
MAPLKNRKIVEETWKKLEPIFSIAHALSHKGRFKIIITLWQAQKPLSFY